MYDIIIVGGGPAGLTAAIYGLRAGKSVLLLEKDSPGGQIASSPKVENIPGIKCISGTDFADNLTDQALSLGLDIEFEKVVLIEKQFNTFVVHTEDNEYYGKTVILAVGVKHRTLGLPGEEDLIGNGISFCAVCDGAFYAGKDVAMIGGGNSALQEALLLSEVCNKITIVQNLASFTGEQKLVDLLLQKENVEVIFSTIVVNYETENNKLSGIKLHNTETNYDSELKVDGVFLAVGLMPENEPFADLVKLNTFGYFDVGEDCTTKTDGLFVAGDCRSKTIRQVVTAAGDGAIAAMAACKYLD